MDEDLILREIVKSLAFEIEAVNQDNVLKWTTTNGTPLRVKVRVRNKDEPRLIQRGAIPVPRIGISAPEKLRLISSDQTILSFNVYLEDTLENEPKRHNGLKIFNIGNCLGTYSDDEGPYLPGSSEQNTLGSDDCSKSGSGILKNKVSKVLSSTNTVPDSQKRFFGKCKPGGCLDPPFGEDNYAYNLRTSDHQENIQIDLHKIKDTKETYEPGGCFDPRFSEDKYPYSAPKTYPQENLELQSDNTEAKKQVISKKSSEASLQYKSLENKIIKEEVHSKKLVSVYARTSRENSLESKYSNSIITYPTDVSSNETLFEQFPNKKISIISKNDESQIQKHDNPVSYFVPPKDVMRYKDDERKYSKRLSSDTINRNARGSVHDEVDKNGYMEDGNIPQNTIRLKDTYEENIKPLFGEQQLRDVAAGTQANPGFKEIPTFVVSDSKKVEECQNSYDEKHELWDLGAIESNLKKNANNNCKSQQQITSPTENDESNNEKIVNLEDNLNTENSQAQRDIPLVKTADIEIKGKLPPLAANYITSNQTSDSRGAQSEELNTQSIKKLAPKPEFSKFSDNLSRITDDCKLEVTDDKNDCVSKETLVSHATIPISATTSCDKQLTQFYDKTSTGFVSSTSEKDTAPFSKIYSVDFLYKNSEQQVYDRDNEPKTSSPQRISSSENNEFDVSSEQSLDLKQELSNVETCNPKDTLGQKEKQIVSVESFNATSTSNVIISRHVSIDSYIKVNTEYQERTSAILQKKPYTARNDLDIQHDDINKISPLKRNTFTVIASDTSIKKYEEIEEIPENINVYLKTTDKSENVSPDLAYNYTDTADINNKRIEGKISSNLNKLPAKIKDLQSEVSNDSNNMNTSIKILENRFQADFGENLSHNPVENVTNLNSIMDQTKLLDSIPKENEMHDIPSRNSLPIEVNSAHSNVVNKRESLLTVQSPPITKILETKDHESQSKNIKYKDADSIHKPSELISDRKESLNQVSKDVGKELHGEFINDLVNKTTLDSIKDLHTETAHLGKKELEIISNINSTTSVSEYHTDTDDLHSKITTYDKFVANPTSEPILENANDLYPKITPNDKSTYSSILDGITDVEIENANTNNNIRSTAIDNSQHLLTNNLYSEMTANAKYISDSFETDGKDLLKKYDNWSADPTPVILPEHSKDSKMTKIKQEKIDLEDFEDKELDIAVHSRSNTDTDFLPKITRKVEELQAQITDDNKFDVADQVHHKNDFLDTRGSELQTKSDKSDVDIQNRKYIIENIESTQFVAESSGFKNKLNEAQYLKDNIYRVVEKTESFSENRSPSGEYSGLLSEVLSNISENGEEEKSKPLQRDNLKESIENDEVFAKIGTEVRGYKTFDNNFPSIIREPRSTSIMSAKYDMGSNLSSKDVPRNSSNKRSISKLNETDSNIHKERMPKAENTKKIAPNVDKLSQRSDEYANHSTPSNIVSDVAFVGDTTYNTDQPIRYQSSNIINGLNEDSFKRNSNKPFKHNKQHNLMKLKVKEKPNLVGVESIPSKKDLNPLYLNMSFYSYINDNKQRVVQTQNPLTDQQNPNDGTVTIVKTLIRHGNEIRIPVDNENDITLNILDKDAEAEENSSIIGSPIRRTLRTKHVVERSKKNNEILNKNLALIYESELIPLHSIIKDLTQEVKTLAAKQEILQTRLRNTKRTKSLRLIPIVKRCGCRRI